MVVGGRLSVLALPITALFAVLVIAVASYHIMSEAENALEARTVANVQNIGAAAVNTIESFWIKPWSRTALRLAQSPDLLCAVESSKSTCAERLRQEWAGVLRADESIFFIYYGLADGRIVFLPDAEPLPRDYDMKSRPWYRDGMSTSGALAWTTPYTEVITRQEILTVVVPLRDAAERVFGVFNIDVSLTQLHTLLRNLFLPAGAALILYDAAGNRLAASGAIAVLNNKELPALSEVPGLDKVSLAGQRYLRQTSAPMDNGWRLALFVESPASGAVFHSARDVMIVSLLAALLIIVVALWGVARRLLAERAKTAALARYFSAAAKGAPLARIFAEHDQYALLNSHFNRALRHARKFTLERERHEKEAFELAFLRAQIKPHFLHNTLNSLLSIMHDDAARASALLVRLSDYLRNSFDFWSEDQFVPLHVEIDLVQDWLAIEAARFEHRVSVRLDIHADRRLRVPAAMLQPIVENALHHGILEHHDTGQINIRISETADALEFSICDDGIGFDPAVIRARPGRRGIGLGNIDSRLRKIYGSGLVIDSTPGEGTCISWRIPHQVSTRHA